MYEAEINKEMKKLKSELSYNFIASRNIKNKLKEIKIGNENNMHHRYNINDNKNHDFINKDNQNKKEFNFKINFKEIYQNNFKTDYSVNRDNMKKPEFKISNDKSNKRLIENWLKISSPEFFKSFSIPNISSKEKHLRVKLNSDDFLINDSYDETQSSNENFPKSKEYFFFRLAENDLFYTKTKLDLNVIGSIQYTKVSKYNSQCISVKDNCDEWSICGESGVIINSFYCAMKKNLKQKSFECQDDEEVEIKSYKNTTSHKKYLQPIVLVPVPSKNCNNNWNYLKQGRDWECLCAEGKLQSPIDLPDKSDVIDSSVRPAFQYHIVEHRLEYSTIDNVLNAGQNIKIQYLNNAIRILHNDLGRIITLDGAVYLAEEIVFHVPSEHTISGKRLAMEMQVIHYGRTKGDIAKQAVLSFLFEKTPGVYNRLIDDIDFFSLPNKSNRQMDIIHDIFVPKVLYRSDDLSYSPVLKPFSFYTYQGSLTFPPCTERTIHYVAAEPIPIGNIFIQLMQEAVRERPKTDQYFVGESLFISEDITMSNYRETQPLNKRDVFYFDHHKYCTPYKREPCDLQVYYNAGEIQEEYQEKYNSNNIVEKTK